VQIFCTHFFWPGFFLAPAIDGIRKTPLVEVNLAPDVLNTSLNGFFVTVNRINKPVIRGNTVSDIVFIMHDEVTKTRTHSINSGRYFDRHCTACLKTRYSRLACVVGPLLIFISHVYISQPQQCTLPACHLVSVCSVAVFSSSSTDALDSKNFKRMHHYNYFRHTNPNRLSPRRRISN